MEFPDHSVFLYTFCDADYGVPGWVPVVVVYSFVVEPQDPASAFVSAYVFLFFLGHIECLLCSNILIRSTVIQGYFRVALKKKILS